MKSKIELKVADEKKGRGLLKSALEYKLQQIEIGLQRTLKNLRLFEERYKMKSNYFYRSLSRDNSLKRMILLILAGVSPFIILAGIQHYIVMYSWVFILFYIFLVCKLLIIKMLANVEKHFFIF